MSATRIRRIFILAELFLTILILFSSSYPVNGDKNEALSAYENADDAIKIAVRHLSEFNGADSSLTELKTRLNEAAAYLDASWLALLDMDYERSIQNSQASQSISVEVVAELASSGKPVSGVFEILDTQLTFMLLEALTVSVFMYIVWRRLRTFYLNNMLRSKPEVKKRES